MKIGFVRRGHSATGGAEAYLLKLAATLRSTGVETTLVTSPDWPDGRWPFGDILRLPAKTPLEFAAAFKNTRTGCDLHFSLERVPGCEVYRAGDGVHAAWLPRRDAFDPFWKRITRWLNRKHSQILQLEREVFSPSNTRIVIANSHLVRDEILAHFDFPAERVSVVYNGTTSMGPLPPRDVARRRFGVEAETFCALFLGTGWERKGLPTALRAVERLANTTLLVAGRGSAAGYPSERAVFVGPVTDIAALFAAADILVLPTWYDPFSNACLEAIAAGLPVITTPSNGVSEILKPGVHGEIVPVGDPLALAEALKNWQVAGRCASAREECLRLAGEFTMERNARETLALLRKAQKMP
jgi:UDP-glucose:(heptosyl)LPS alpha-1,3-glucosyltransferase